MNTYNKHMYLNFKQQICAFLGVEKYSSRNKHLTCSQKRDDMPKSMRDSVCQEAERQYHLHTSQP